MQIAEINASSEHLAQASLRPSCEVNTSPWCNSVIAIIYNVIDNKVLDLTKDWLAVVHF